MASFPTNRLSIIMKELRRPRYPGDVPKRIDLCEEALKLVDKSMQPELWANLHGELAVSYSDNQVGDQAANLKKAIHHFTMTSEVFTRSANAERWALTKFNMGNAYYRLRIHSDEEENIERAIELFQQALEVWTRLTSAKSWANAKTNLAIAYAERIRGEPKDNTELAIKHFKDTLQVYTQSAFPAEYARTQKNLTVANAKLFQLALNKKK